MLLDLEKVPPEGQAIDRSVDPSSLPIDSREFRVSQPVRISGHLAKADGEAFRLSGRLSSDVEVACVRCLEPFALELREDFDLLYLPQSENVAADGENDLGLGDDELAVSFYRDNEIDLTHMTWEQIVLALPMKPVCKPECHGLCPNCGANLNAKTCSCVRDNVDPRWQTLKSLLDP